MKLSVILPCFNGAATIALQLEALTHQHWAGGWEVLVVNNGSTDESMEIVSGYQARLPGLRIVQAHVPGTPRLGVPHSYNSGIQCASGEAFVFCEADDEVAPGWLEAMGRALEEHEFVAARLDHRKLNDEWAHPLDGGYQSQGLWRVNRYPYLLTASACAFGLRRSLYETVGPFSTAFPFVHDAEYCWRAQRAGHTLHFVPGALVFYREKPDHWGRFRQGQNWGRDFTRLLNHYGSPLGAFPLLRQWLWIGAYLPRGCWALLMFVLGRREGRPLFGQWIWHLGWSTGKLQALAQRSRAGR